MLGPVRIKAYGLVEFTKAQYIRTQTAVFILTLVLLALAALWRPTGAWAASPFFANLFWFILIVLIAEVAETAVMLSKFRSKEALRSGKGLT